MTARKSTAREPRHGERTTRACSSGGAGGGRFELRCAFRRDGSALRIDLFVIVVIVVIVFFVFAAALGGGFGIDSPVICRGAVTPRCIHIQVSG